MAPIDEVIMFTEAFDRGKIEQPKPIILKVLVKADAQLVLWLPDGTKRVPTKEELLSLRLHHESDMYNRTHELLDLVFGEDTDDLPKRRLLRYFIEHITHYAHELEPVELDNMKRLVGGDIPQSAAQARCPDCGEPQFPCPSGVTCENGHGY